MPQHIIDLIKAIDDIDSGDYNATMLARAMHHYCSAWDMCEGFKYAIKKTLEDQYTNHASEQPTDDVIELKKILGL